MDTTRYEAQIHELDRDLAPGSETALLGPALDSIRRATDPVADLAWWRGAYRMAAWAEQHPARWATLYGEPYDQPDAYALILSMQVDDWTGWTPPTPSPDELRAWREAEGLTQSTAARVARVGIRAWQRWESGERGVPENLSDTLVVRWGSCP